MIYLLLVNKTRKRLVLNKSSYSYLVPPQFIGENNLIEQQTVIEGTSLRLSCSAYGRPKPSITWFYRTNNGKHIVCK